MEEKRDLGGGGGGEGITAYSLLIDDNRTKAVIATEMLQEMCKSKSHRHLKIHYGMYCLCQYMNLEKSSEFILHKSVIQEQKISGQLKCRFSPSILPRILYPELISISFTNRLTEKSFSQNTTI